MTSAELGNSSEILAAARRVLTAIGALPESGATD
ncbi:MAG: hypothetical protein KatS3mg125_1822 [Lysobacterales bacterium]|jgi:hypothetical protein|nr:MAG: hypothetical protein KatS3mg125_1822 [Xanthomonadales bacterium]